MLFKSNTAIQQKVVFIISMFWGYSETLKALFVLKLIKFLSWLFGHAEKNSLIKKVRLTSKFMTSQPINKQLNTNIAQYLKK